MNNVPNHFAVIQSITNYGDGGSNAPSTVTTFIDGMTEDGAHALVDRLKLKLMSRGLQDKVFYYVARR